MKNQKAVLLYKMLGVIFIISLIYALTIKYPDYSSSFDMGFSTGTAFGQAIKILGTIGLITYGIRTMRRRGKKTLE